MKKWLGDLSWFDVVAVLGMSAVLVALVAFTCFVINLFRGLP